MPSSTTQQYGAGVVTESSSSVANSISVAEKAAWQG